MRKVKYTLALAFLLSNLIMAQDTLVKTSGETLVGRLFFGIDSFQKEYITIKIDRKKKRIKLLEVRQIKMANGDIIKPVGYGGVYKFGKEVVSGYMTYYKVSASNSSEKFTADLLYKMDGTYQLYEGKIAFRNRTKEFLSDCLTVSKAVNDKKYKKQDLTRLTQDYNNCLESKGFSDPVQPSTETISKKAQNKAQQLSKSLEQKLSDFSALLRDSDKISDKKDVTAMFNDVAGKLRRKEAIPNYLKTALTATLKGDAQLSKLIKEILGAN